MCGIAGIWGLNGSIPSKNEMVKMLAVQGHRGPEGAAFTKMDENRLLLGFLKLGFTDNMHGMQPLFNEDGNIAIVYNGEIYDYKPLRQDLIAKGHRFYTHSDSEVLIHLYEEYGIDFLHHLNGEFAFALYDHHKRQLVMARDPFGVNPLCYAYHNGQFLFSSEAKGILATAGFPRSINKDYLTSVGLGIPNTENTLFNNITNLKPGHCAILSADGKKVFQYWKPDFSKTTDSYEDARWKVKDLLTQSVRRRLEGNPPIALALSSGLDSTIVAAVVRSLGHTPTTFSMGFKGRDFNEAHVAASTARFLNMPHHTEEITHESLLKSFMKSLWHTENVTNSLSNTGRLLTNNAIRQQGFKAVMGGESSDELFGGYPFFSLEYYWEKQQEYNSMDKQILRTFKQREKLSKRIFWDGNKNTKQLNPYHTAHVAFFRAVRAKKLATLIWSADVLNGATKTALQSFIEEVPPSSLAQLDVFDKSRMISRSVASTFVFPGLGDRLEMGHSLEGRVPFLDSDLIKYVYTLPAEYFLDQKQLTGKRILKDALKSLLPPGFAAPPKHTFMSPKFKELYNLKEGRDLFDVYLSAGEVKKRGLLNTKNHFLTQALWKTSLVGGSYGLFLDSLIGLKLSVQLLHELFVVRHPLEEVNLERFELKEHYPQAIKTFAI